MDGPTDMHMSMNVKVKELLSELLLYIQQSIYHEIRFCLKIKITQHSPCKYSCKTCYNVSCGHWPVYFILYYVFLMLIFNKIHDGTVHHHHHSKYFVQLSVFTFKPAPDFLKRCIKPETMNCKWSIWQTHVTKDQAFQKGKCCTLSLQLLPSFRSNLGISQVAVLKSLPSPPRQWDSWHGRAAICQPGIKPWSNSFEQNVEQEFHVLTINNVSLLLRKMFITRSFKIPAILFFF